MENNVEFEFHRSYDRKAWFTSQTILKTKFEINGTTRILEYDISSSVINKNYIRQRTEENPFYLLHRYTEGDTVRISRRFGTSIYRGYERITKPFPTNDSDYPFYVYVNERENETETDEPTTTFYHFPPPETDAQWARRIEGRITNLARCFADGLPAQYARLSALTEKIHSSGIGENHAYGDRYDSAATVGQHVIGFIRWQFKKLRDGETEKLFKTKEELEAHIDKVEAVIKDENWVKDFYLKHNRNRWNAHSRLGRVNIPTDNFDLGEKIHDTVRAPIGQLPTEEEQEMQTETELATICENFGHALHSTNSEVVDQYQVEAEEYTPDFRNTNLRELTVSTDVEALTLHAPTGSGDPDGFAPDRTTYHVLLPVGKNAVGVVAFAEHTDATVTGMGDVTITDRSVVTVVNVVVTSEDTHATKTYTINILALTE